MALRVHPFEPLNVHGKVPEGLVGALYRTGPALFERGGERLSHPFEADGGLVGVRFEPGGRVYGAVDYVRGRHFEREERAGRFLSGGSVSRWRRIVGALRGEVKNTGNTSVMHWQNRLFTLMEASVPIEMDPRTLSTRGETNLDGTIARAFSAHPHALPSGDLINFGVVFGPRTHLDVFRLPRSGSSAKLGEVSMPWPTMLHDFAVIEDHLVFLCGPAQLQMAKAVLGEVDIERLFRWRPEQGARILIAPLADLSAARMIEIPAAWVWHVVGGFRDGDAWVFDVSEYPDMQSLSAIRDESTIVPPPRWVRYRIDPGAARAEKARMLELPMEFPSVHRDGDSSRYRHVLFQTIPEGETRARGTGGVGRFDLERERLDHFVFPRGVNVSEPLLAPKAGCVLCLVNDEQRQRSRVCMFDARRIEDGPICEVEFDALLHQTFHGIFVEGSEVLGAALEPRAA